ncbi:hypothetical protein BDY24DRAFT_417639 [Mrakia frigida]|uniref:DUF6534 domain-containing protein n=1 Tax=Mrakia frigida TaxID=29902 RepID=UPI003FCC05DB
MPLFKLSHSILLAALGPWLMAALAVFWGSGFLMAEILLYFHRFSALDPLLMKVGICLLWLVNLLQDLQAGGLAIEMFAAHFGNYAYLIAGSWLTYTTPPVSAAIIFLCQVFFSYRSYKCIGSQKLRRVFLCVAVPLVLCTLIAGIFVGVSLAKGSQYSSSLVSGILIPLIIWISLMLATDFVITSVLLYFLHQQIRDTEETQSLVEKLLILTFESVLPPALCALATLITFLCVKNSSVFIFLLGKLYSISLLHTLNGRWRLRKKMAAPRALAPTSTYGTSGKVPGFHRSKEAYPMDNPSNWRGDQDLVDLDSWRRAGLGEFEEEETTRRCNVRLIYNVFAVEETKGRRVESFASPPLLVTELRVSASPGDLKADP